MIFRAKTSRDDLYWPSLLILKHKGGPSFSWPLNSSSSRKRCDEVTWDRTVPHGVGVLPVQDEPQQKEDNSIAIRLSWQRSKMAW